MTITTYLRQVFWKIAFTSNRFISIRISGSYTRSANLTRHSYSHTWPRSREAFSRLLLLQIQTYILRFNACTYL